MISHLLSVDTFPTLSSTHLAVDLLSMLYSPPLLALWPLFPIAPLIPAHDYPCSCPIPPPSLPLLTVYKISSKRHGTRLMCSTTWIYSFLLHFWHPSSWILLFQLKMNQRSCVFANFDSPLKLLLLLPQLLSLHTISSSSSVGKLANTMRLSVFPSLVLSYNSLLLLSEIQKLLICSPLGTRTFLPVSCVPSHFLIYFMPALTHLTSRPLNFLTPLWLFPVYKYTVISLVLRKSHHWAYESLQPQQLIE